MPRVTPVTSRLVLPLAVALALSGCTGDASAPRDPETAPGPPAAGSSAATAPDWRAVGGGALLPGNGHGDRSPIHRVTATLATRADEGPALLGGWSTHGDGLPQGTVWPADADDLDQGRAVGPRGAASMVRDLLQHGDTTWVLGESWADGVWTPWLASSTDRASWRTVGVATADDPSRGVRAERLLPGPSTPLLVGRTPDGSVSVQGPDTAVPVAVLSVRGPGTVGTVVGAQASGPDGRAVIAARVERGGRTELQTWTAPVQQGAPGPWSAASALPGTGAEAQGLARSDGTWFIAGAHTVGTPQGAVARPALWSSTDGSTWNRLPGPDHALEDGWAATFGAPAAVTGGIAVTTTDSSRLLLRTHVRSANGAWRRLSDLSPDSPDLVGLMTADEGRPMLLSHWQHDTSVHRWTGERWEHDVHTGPDLRADLWRGLLPDGNHPVLVSARHEVDDLGGGSWQRHLSEAAWVVNGSELGVGEFPGVVGAGWKPLAAQSDPTAEDSRLLVTAGEQDRDGDDDGIDLAVRTRSEDGTWQVGTGLALPGTESFGALGGTGGNWVLAGETRASWSGRHPARAVLFTSTDGVAWNRVALDIGDGSSLSGVCRVGEDTLVVGVAGSGRPLALTGRGAEWTRSELTGVGKAREFTGCASTAGVTLVQGRAADGAAVWSTTDGQTFTRVTPTGPGPDDDLGPVRAVHGQFVAPGVRREGAVEQPVLWRFDENLAGTAEPLPSPTPARAVDVTGFGGSGLLVPLEGPTGLRAAVRPDARTAGD